MEQPAEEVGVEVVDLCLCDGAAEGVWGYSQKDGEGSEDGVGSTGPGTIPVSLYREGNRQRHVGWEDGG